MADKHKQREIHRKGLTERQTDRQGQRGRHRCRQKDRDRRTDKRDRDRETQTGRQRQTETDRQKDSCNPLYWDSRSAGTATVGASDNVCIGENKSVRSVHKLPDQRGRRDFALGVNIKLFRVRV